MKIVAAAFTTALSVFIIASVMSEFTSPRNAVAARIVSHKEDHADVERSSSPASKNRRRSESNDEREAKGDAAVQQRTLEMQRQISEIRQRETEVKAKQEALRIIFDEIREEQQSVEIARQHLSEEIAAVRNAAASLAQRGAGGNDRGALITDQTRSGIRSTSSKNAKAPFPISDTQAARDTAVLIRRLAQQGSYSAANSLLRAMRDRDAAKVLSVLSATDAQMALQLADNLQASRQGTDRR